MYIIKYTIIQKSNTKSTYKYNMAAANENPVRKCWTIQHSYANRYNADTFDTTAVYTTAEGVREAILETIDELEESINLGERERPRYMASREYFTVDVLNNMVPNNWMLDGSIIYEYPELVVAVIARALV